jgi:hypothetical protein
MVQSIQSNYMEEWIDALSYEIPSASASVPMKGGGGIGQGFTPGYADMIGDTLSQALKAKAANPFVKALVSILVTVLAIVIVFAVISLILYLMVRGRVEEIQANWPQNRCKITIMPIASYVGPPGTTNGGNFSECMEDFLGKYLEKKFAPLFGLFTKIFGILNTITESVQQVRIMIHSIRNTIMNMAQDVYKKLKDVYYRIAYLVKRVVQILVYIFLLFRNIFYVLKYSKMTFKSVTDNWLFRWCFHPEQMIPQRISRHQEWNEYGMMKNLEIGTYVNPKRPELIRGIWRFQKPNKEYQTWIHSNGWIVTPGHYTFNQQEQRWECATESFGNHSQDKSIIWSPWTDSGILHNYHGDKAFDYWGNGTIDFERNLTLQAILKAQQKDIILHYDYMELLHCLGYKRWSSMGLLNGKVQIPLQNGATRQLKDIALGDILEDGGIVIGICKADAFTFQWRHNSTLYPNLFLTDGVWFQENKTINKNEWTSVTFQPTFWKLDTPPCTIGYTLQTTTGQFIIQDNNGETKWNIKDGMGWHTTDDDKQHYQKLIQAQSKK